MYKYPFRGTRSNSLGELMDFKKYLLEDCNDPSIVKWDVVLFLGEYSPITKHEYERINQFVETVIKNPQWSAKFANRVDIGLVTDNPTKEDHLDLETHYQLTFKEKNFITTKLFGLKMLNIDFSDIGYLSKIPSKKEEFTSKSLDIVGLFKKIFHKANILVVLRPEDKPNEQGFRSLQTYLHDPDIKLGFIYFNDDIKLEYDYLKGIPCNGETIKIITLMNSEKPDPEELRGFASKYKIFDRMNDIRKIHFRTHGDKYYLAFEQFFPKLNVNDEQEEESIKSNYEVVMTLLKEMYLKFVQ